MAELLHLFAENGLRTEKGRHPEAAALHSLDGIASDIVRYRFSEGTTTAWFGSFDGLATTRPFGSPLLRPDDQSAVSRSACPLRRRRAVRPGPVAPTAWDRNPPGQSATSRSTASSVCAANRACASSCSCFVCKEEQARRFRAPGREM